MGKDKREKKEYFEIKIKDSLSIKR